MPRKMINQGGTRRSGPDDPTFKSLLAQRRKQYVNLNNKVGSIITPDSQMLPYLNPSLNQGKSINRIPGLSKQDIERARRNYQAPIEAKGPIQNPPSGGSKNNNKNFKLPTNKTTQWV